MPKKIFIGLTDIASVLSDVKLGFKELGYDSFVVIGTSNGVISKNYSDIDISKLKAKVKAFSPKWIGNRVKNRYDKYINNWIFAKAVKECDIFVFVWNTFNFDYSDYKILHEMGKKIITVFVGDDARWVLGAEQEFKMYNLHPVEGYEETQKSFKYLENNLSHIRLAEKYSEMVFSRVDQGQLHLRPYHRWNMMVIPELFKCDTSQRKEKPVVVHAPSHRGIKGTEHVLAAFEKLKKEGVAFEPVLIENMEYEQAVKIYETADIVIDQLLLPGTGKLASEALACGAVVMGHMAYDSYPQKNPEECPIIDVNPHTLCDKLKAIILDYDRRVELAELSRPYAKKYLDTRIFCKRIIDHVNGIDVGYDYYPDFFRNHYKPVLEGEQELQNKWINEVKGCDWYKQYVSAGEREGLKF